MLIECKECGASRPWNHKRDGALAKQLCDGPECGSRGGFRIHKGARSAPATPAQAIAQAREPEPISPDAGLRRFRTVAEACEATKCPRGHLAHCAGSVCSDFRTAPVINPTNSKPEAVILACGVHGRGDTAMLFGYVPDNQRAAEATASVLRAAAYAQHAQGGAA